MLINQNLNCQWGAYYVSCSVQDTGRLIVIKHAIQLVLHFYLCLSYNTTFSGATNSVYAPEPFDVGRILQVDIISESEHVTLSTAGPIDPGLVSI